MSTTTNPSAEPSADAKPYVLFRDALEKAGRVAVVKVALRNRERLAVLRPREGVLVVQTMLWPDEVRRPDFKFLDDDIDVRPQEMRMAESYIDAMAEEFEPTEYVDDYREALLQVVEAKVEGAEITRPPEAEPDEGKVVDLMEALRRSVAEAKKQRGEASEEPAPRAKKAAAKKATAKKAPAKKATAKKAAAKRKSA